MPSPSVTEGAQIHLRHGHMGGDYDASDGGEGRDIGGGGLWRWRIIRQWWERY